MTLARKSPNSRWCPGSCWTSTASAKAWGLLQSWGVMSTLCSAAEAVSLLTWPLLSPSMAGRPWQGRVFPEQPAGKWSLKEMLES